MKASVVGMSLRYGDSVRIRIVRSSAGHGVAAKLRRREGWCGGGRRHSMVLINRDLVATRIRQTTLDKKRELKRISTLCVVCLAWTSIVWDDHKETQ